MPYFKCKYVHVQKNDNVLLTSFCFCLKLFKWHASRKELKKSINNYKTLFWYISSNVFSVIMFRNRRDELDVRSELCLERKALCFELGFGT